MPVYIFESNEQLGRRAANDLAVLLDRIIKERAHVSIIFATGSSMLTFIAALRAKRDIAWDKVTVFHQDEYLGLSEQHPASFARYIREKLVAFVHPAAYYPIRGHIKCEIRNAALCQPVGRVSPRGVYRGYR